MSDLRTQLASLIAALDQQQPTATAPTAPTSPPVPMSQASAPAPGIDINALAGAIARAMPQPQPIAQNPGRPVSDRGTPNHYAPDPAHWQTELATNPVFLSPAGYAQMVAELGPAEARRRHMERSMHQAESIKIDMRKK